MTNSWMGDPPGMPSSFGHGYSWPNPMGVGYVPDPAHTAAMIALAAAINRHAAALENANQSRKPSIFK